MIKDCWVGVKGIVRVGDSCLMLKMVKEDRAYWDVPGGRIDDDETIIDTLHRELHEELPSIGEFEVGDIVGAYRLNKNLEGGRGLVLIFYTVLAKEFEVTLSDEHSEYRWVTRENVSELLDSGIPISPQVYQFVTQTLEK